MKKTKSVLLFASALSFLMLVGCTNKQEDKTSTTTNSVSFDEVLKTRRSVRSYDPNIVRYRR